MVSGWSNTSPPNGESKSGEKIRPSGRAFPEPPLKFPPEERGRSFGHLDEVRGPFSPRRGRSSSSCQWGHPTGQSKPLLAREASDSGELRGLVAVNVLKEGSRSSSNAGVGGVQDIAKLTQTSDRIRKATDG